MGALNTPERYWQCSVGRRVPPEPLGPHLFGAVDLLQEGAQLSGLGEEGATHRLVVSGGVRRTGEMGGAQLRERKIRRERVRDG